MQFQICLSSWFLLVFKHARFVTIKAHQLIKQEKGTGKEQRCATFVKRNRIHVYTGLHAIKYLSSQHTKLLMQKLSVPATKYSIFTKQKQKGTGVEQQERLRPFPILLFCLVFLWPAKLNSRGVTFRFPWTFFGCFNGQRQIFNSGINFPWAFKLEKADFFESLALLTISKRGIQEELFQI